MLLQKEEQLKVLRNGSRVILGEVDVPEDEQLDKEVRLTQGYKTENRRDIFCDLTSTVFDILCRGFWQWCVQQ